MEALEYITYKAMMECTEGSAPGLFTPTYNQTTKINGCLVSTQADKKPIENIPDFVVCKKGGKCTPAPTTWLDTYPVKVKGQETLIGKSCNMCGKGGTIQFLTSGQVPLTPEEEEQLNGMRDDVAKAYEKEQEEKNKPWWKKAGEFIVDCVPVVGPIVSLVKNVSEGNWGMAMLDVGFLALDVVGLVTAPVTGGGSVVAATAAKAGIRQAVKAGAKQVAKKLSKEALELAAKQSVEMLQKLSVRSLTSGKLCVFACFPAGTKVAVADGLKNIEEIGIGEKVWAWDEDTGTTSLQPVVNTMEREAHTLVTLQMGKENITCTAEHPFYVDGKWLEAGLIVAGTHLQLLNGKHALVNQVTYHYNAAEVNKGNLIIDGNNDIAVINSNNQDVEGTVTVYNIEVAHAHTYFVGEAGVLVHNSQAGICIKGVVKKVSNRLRYMGRTPGKNSATGKKVFDRMLNAKPPQARIKNGKKQFKSRKDKKWYDLDKADMSHEHDAVDWWNTVAVPNGYKPKGPEVREWMKKSNNYYLEHRTYNRRDGAKLGKTYNDPIKP